MEDSVYKFWPGGWHVRGWDGEAWRAWVESLTDGPEKCSVAALPCVVLRLLVCVRVRCGSVYPCAVPVEGVPDVLGARVGKVLGWAERVCNVDRVGCVVEGPEEPVVAFGSVWLSVYDSVF